MTTKSQIDKLHSVLSQRLGKLAARKMKIEARTHNWHNAAVRTPFFFEMMGDDPAFTVAESGSRKRPTFPLSSLAPDIPGVWWSWSEEWCKVSAKDFQIIGAGFAFFWGTRSQRKQLFRAEWDAASERGNSAGQPHWHVDGRIQIGVGAASVSHGGFEPESSYEALLKPTSDPSLDAVVIKEAHLFMGGWKNHGHVPQCMQSTPDHENLADWAERVLDYVTRESENIRPWSAV